MDLVLTVSKDPTTSASVSASGSASGSARATASAGRTSADRGASASTGEGGCDSEGSRGNPRGVEAHRLARPTVRTCALLPGPSIGVCLSGGEEHLRSLGRRCRINRRLAQADLYLGAVHASVHGPSPFLFISTVNTNLSSSPFPPPQRLLRNSSHRTASHRTASHFIAPHHNTARLCPALHLASRTVESQHQQPKHFTSSPQPRNRAFLFHCSIASSRDFPSTPPSTHLFIASSIQSKLTYRNRVITSSTKPTLSQSPRSRLLHSDPPHHFHLP